MNDHEAERIAAAMHAARPDWPTSSILTLIRKNLIDRPRRDVFVALAWVASEPASHTPARVLEVGPWWKAAGIEGQAMHREVLDPADRCGICSHPKNGVHLDHEFEPDFRPLVAPEEVSARVDQLRAELTVPVSRPAPVHPTPEESK